jgi:hypothetical protein
VQVASKWNQKAWIRQLPQHREFLEALGTNRMDRLEALKRVEVPTLFELCPPWAPNNGHNSSSICHARGK